MANNKILLLGAGFSKNWDGWLAKEFYGDLLNRKQIEASFELTHLLRDHKTKGGFESVLEYLQRQCELSYSAKSKEMLDQFQAAVLETLADMNKGFVNQGAFQFELPQKGGIIERDATVSNFMAGFDAIFTVNQDLLLEMHYLDVNVSAHSMNRFTKAYMPAMHEMPDPGRILKDWLKVRWKPAAAEVGKPLAARMQPYVKLHGSAGWLDANNEPILVMGGNKAGMIATSGILQWYLQLFEEFLSRTATRLVVIGYGFGDQHINEAICAAGSGELKMSIIDPLGEDVIKNAPSRFNNEDRDQLFGLVRGEETQTLGKIFDGSGSALNRLRRFLDG